MSRKRDSDCCEYREAKRLAQQKLRKKMQASMKIEKKRGNDDCDDEDEELEIEQKERCEEKRAQRVEALAKLLSIGDEMMRRIKPSIEERDKYSMSYRHIRCFLEPAEIERMELEARMRSILKCTPCESEQSQLSKFDKHQMPADKKRKKKRKKKKKNKDNESSVDESKEQNEKVENKTDSATENEEEAEAGLESGETEEPEKDEEKSNKEKDKSARKNEFWCREVKKKAKPKRDERQFEIDCKDSICSFDSEFDLSGLALTKEELKKIAKARRSKTASKSKDAR